LGSNSSSFGEAKGQGSTLRPFGHLPVAAAAAGTVYSMSTHSKVPDLIASMQAEDEIDQLTGDELLAAFRDYLGDLFIDASSISYISELGVGELAIVERGLFYPPGGRVRFRREWRTAAAPRGTTAPWGGGQTPTSACHHAHLRQQ
jgi:hypothetical protein